MRRRFALLTLLALALAIVLPSAGAGKRVPTPPKAFFGISPQTELTDADVEYMRAARIGSIRWPIGWDGVQPTPRREYNWAAFDHVVTMAAKGGMRVLPFIYATPRKSVTR